MIRTTQRDVQLNECIDEVRWRLGVWLFTDTPAIASTERCACGTLEHVRVSTCSSIRLLSCNIDRKINVSELSVPRTRIGVQKGRKRLSGGL